MRSAKWFFAIEFEDLINSTLSLINAKANVRTPATMYRKITFFHI